MIDREEEKKYNRKKEIRRRVRKMGKRKMKERKYRIISRLKWKGNGGKDLKGTVQ
jgi:hypothetical protein